MVIEIIINFFQYFIGVILMKNLQSNFMLLHLSISTFL
jgi:hypothetical protein